MSLVKRLMSHELVMVALAAAAVPATTMANDHNGDKKPAEVSRKRPSPNTGNEKSDYMNSMGTTEITSSTDINAVSNNASPTNVRGK